MQFKLRLAGAAALVGTLFTVLLSAQGSGAAAEAMIPRLVLPETSVTQFVSQPVVQSVPSPASEAAADFAQNDRPDTLDELVAAQPTGSDLSGQMRCLAGAIYFEARGESLEGQLAVAKVVVDRASSGRFPATYCGVVYQPSQFSFIQGGSMPAVRTASHAWHEAVAIARIADQGTWSSMAKGALYFHAARVAPGWKRLTRLAQVDNHVFYR